MATKSTLVLDQERGKEMDSLVEKLTTTGKHQLDEELLKKLKKICKQSDEYVERCCHMLLTQLEKPHSEIRLSVVQLCDVLFMRSHCFRDQLLIDFRYFMDLTVESNQDIPLPPPQPASKALKTFSIECINKWQQKFGTVYKKLSLGYHFLKSCKKIDFEDISARNLAEQQAEEERRRRMAALQQDLFDKTLQEMNEGIGEVRICLTQADNCLVLLLPAPEGFTLQSPTSPNFFPPHSPWAARQPVNKSTKHYPSSGPDSKEPGIDKQQSNCDKLSKESTELKEVKQEPGTDKKQNKLRHNTSPEEQRSSDMESPMKEKPGKDKTEDISGVSKSEKHRRSSGMRSETDLQVKQEPGTEKHGRSSGTRSTGLQVKQEPGTEKHGCSSGTRSTGVQVKQEPGTEKHGRSSGTRSTGLQVKQEPGTEKHGRSSGTKSTGLQVKQEPGTEKPHRTSDRRKRSSSSDADKSSRHKSTDSETKSLVHRSNSRSNSDRSQGHRSRSGVNKSDKHKSSSRSKSNEPQNNSSSNQSNTHQRSSRSMSMKSKQSIADSKTPQKLQDSGTESPTQLGTDVPIKTERDISGSLAAINQGSYAQSHTVHAVHTVHGVHTVHAVHTVHGVESRVTEPDVKPTPQTLAAHTAQYLRDTAASSNHGNRDTETSSNHGNSVTETSSNHGNSATYTSSNHGNIVTYTSSNHGNSVTDTSSNHGNSATDTSSNRGKSAAATSSNHGNLDCNMQCLASGNRSDQDAAAQKSPQETKSDTISGSPSNNVHSLVTMEGEEFEEMSEDEEDEEDEEEESCEEEDFVRGHGLGSQLYSIDVALTTDAISVQETADNEDILHNLKDCVRLINTKLLPATHRWLEIFSKTGADQTHIKKALDIKATLEKMKAKIGKLKIHKTPKLVLPKLTESGDEDEDEDEDDFEEVQAKEGYEADIPAELREEYGLVDKAPRPSTNPDWVLSQSLVTDEDDPASFMSTVRKLQQRSARDRNSPVSQEYRVDSQASTSRVQGSQASTSGVPESSIKPGTSGTQKHVGAESGNHGNKRAKLEGVPVLPFSMDLYHWGQKIETPLIVRTEDDSRFWIAKNQAEVVDVDALAAMKSRVINFVGKFEPVKWRCRAPMPNGTLCQRMDRHKCPFHGEIVARGEMGQPEKPEDDARIKREEEKKEAEQPADWEDPVFLADLKAATGIDLSSKKKRGKKKERTKKYPGLTDVQKVSNTSRTRLESKVLNKGAVKRVAEAYNAIDEKKRMDKFGNNFNYVHSKAKK